MKLIILQLHQLIYIVFEIKGIHMTVLHHLIHMKRLLKFSESS